MESRLIIFSFHLAGTDLYNPLVLLLRAQAVGWGDQASWPSTEGEHLNCGEVKARWETNIKIIWILTNSVKWNRDFKKRSKIVSKKRVNSSRYPGKLIFTMEPLAAKANKERMSHYLIIPCQWKKAHWYSDRKCVPGAKHKTEFIMEMMNFW